MKLQRPGSSIPNKAFPTKVSLKHVFKLVGVLVGMLVLSGGMFAAGYVYRSYNLFSQPQVTKQPLKLYLANGAGQTGRLPAGATLYSLGGLDELPHFMLIVGTKELSTLRPSPAQHAFEKVPIEAARE